MLHTSISELTTLRWDLATEVEGLARHGFRSMSIWRTKLSDLSIDEARETLERAGMRVSSLQWAGGFTGGDGRTFRESLDDALLIGCGDGAVRLLRVQREGRGVQAAEDFLRGFALPASQL